MVVKDTTSKKNLGCYSVPTMLVKQNRDCFSLEETPWWCFNREYLCTPSGKQLFSTEISSLKPMIFSIDGHEHLRNEMGVINLFAHTYSGSVWDIWELESLRSLVQIQLHHSVWRIAQSGRAVGDRVLVYVGTGCVISQFNSDCQRLAR